MTNVSSHTVVCRTGKESLATHSYSHTIIRYITWRRKLTFIACVQLGFLYIGTHMCMYVMKKCTDVMEKALMSATHSPPAALTLTHYISFWTSTIKTTTTRVAQKESPANTGIHKQQEQATNAPLVCALL